MKHLQLLFILLIMAGLTCSCQHHEPPEQVKKAFTEKFPSAESVEWELEDDTIWEAEFFLNGKEITAIFSAGGKWLKTEEETDEEEEVNDDGEDEENDENDDDGEGEDDDDVEGEDDDDGQDDS